MSVHYIIFMPFYKSEIFHNFFDFLKLNSLPSFKIRSLLLKKSNFWFHLKEDGAAVGPHHSQVTAGWGRVCPSPLDQARAHLLAAAPANQSTHCCTFVDILVCRLYFMLELYCVRKSTQAFCDFWAPRIAPSFHQPLVWGRR